MAIDAVSSVTSTPPIQSLDTLEQAVLFPLLTPGSEVEDTNPLLPNDNSLAAKNRLVEPDPINANQVAAPLTAAESPVVNRGTLEYQGLYQAETVSNAVPASVATPAALPDAMPSMLQGIYQAPAVSHHFSGAFVGDSVDSNAQAMLHVMAPTAVSAMAEHAQGRAFNANTYSLSPAATESIASHAARLATGKSLVTQRIVSDTHEAFVGHSLDLFA